MKNKQTNMLWRIWWENKADRQFDMYAAQMLGLRDGKGQWEKYNQLAHLLKWITPFSALLARDDEEDMESKAGSGGWPSKWSDNCRAL